jgi:hypothetical protein
MTSTMTALGLMAPVAMLTLAGGMAHAQVNDMFPTKAAAEKRGKELNCSGAFAMGSEWMPCTTFEAYEKALTRQSR